MGLYDTVTVGMPLPGENPYNYNHFQTKSLGSRMDDYTITKNGDLRLNGELVPFSGDLECYTSNFRAGANGCTFTAKGEDFVSATWLFDVLDGHVVGVGQTEFSRKPALPYSMLIHRKDDSTPEEARRYDEVQTADLAGSTMYLRWGSLDDNDRGYWVKVLSSNKKQLVVEDSNGDFETLYRSTFGSTLFDSKEAAAAYVAQRKATAEEHAEFYRKALEERNSTHLNSR